MTSVHDVVREALAVRLASTLRSEDDKETVDALTSATVDEVLLGVEVKRLNAGARCREILNEIHADDSTDTEEVKAMFAAIANGIAGNRPRRRL
jgi:hypothetical protein